MIGRAPALKVLGLLGLVSLTGCGQRPCATTDDPGRDGALLSATLDGPREAVESGLRHFSGIITYGWFEVETDCVTDGELFVGGHDTEHDLAFPLLQSPDEANLWGGWREVEGKGALLWLDWTDESEGCFGEESGQESDCVGWPEGEHDLRGPWMSAADWYIEIWWPLVTGVE